MQVQEILQNLWLWKLWKVKAIINPMMMHGSTGSSSYPWRIPDSEAPTEAGTHSMGTMRPRRPTSRSGWEACRSSRRWRRSRQVSCSFLAGNVRTHTFSPLVMVVVDKCCKHVLMSVRSCDDSDFLSNRQQVDRDSGRESAYFFILCLDRAVFGSYELHQRYIK